MPANRFVFVAGLHRTGTSILARMIGAHPQVSMIEGAPVPENEGCYLQGAIPHTALDGRPGHFATDPAQHHTEASPYNCLEAKRRLLADWSPWFDSSKPWWLEKSPVNLMRMRLYQQLFPTSQFIVVLRHPQMMAAALQKWVADDPQTLLAHGLDAYRIMRSDLPYLHSVLVLRYEDLVARPDMLRPALSRFLSLDDHDAGLELRDGNADYRVTESVEPETAQALAQWGYRPGGGVVPWRPYLSHPLREVREATEAAVTGADNEKFDPLAEKGTES